MCCRESSSVRLRSGRSAPRDKASLVGFVGVPPRSGGGATRSGRDRHGGLEKILRKREQFVSTFHSHHGSKSLSRCKSVLIGAAAAAAGLLAAGNWQNANA